MICNVFYDQCVYDCIDQYMEDNTKGKSKEELHHFIESCIGDLITYDYTEHDHRIVDLHTFKRYMLDHYKVEHIFESMNGRQAADAIQYFEDVDFISEMIPDVITLEDMLNLYYISHLHYNKDKILKYLLSYLK